MTLHQRIKAFVKLGEYIAQKPEHLDAYVQRTTHHNGWFTAENQWHMLSAVASQYLDAANLEHWVESVGIGSKDASLPNKTVGLVLAGNIPLVGFHDVLAVLIAGLNAEIKLSSKDPFVLPFLLKQLEQLEPQFEGSFRFVERLKNYDAIIATGSDNTSRYFQQYFGHVPHIIRGNRTSVAVLDGEESAEELRALARDIFTYFGMGCRSVSKIYVPSGYDFNPLLEILHEHKQLANHTKWKNNYDYNFALHTINKEPFLTTGPLLLREDSSFHSRLAMLHYEAYKDISTVTQDLNVNAAKIQAVVSKNELAKLPTVSFGEGQNPGLADYADGVNTLAFLSQL